MTNTKPCECGCGQPAPIAKTTNRRDGRIKGQPARFISGHNNTTHGMSHSPEYSSYENAKRRCRNPNCKEFKDYGGRGIEFRFDSFEQFFAEIGLRPKGKTLDRIDNHGHYEAGNVQWATKSEQQYKRRLPVDRVMPERRVDIDSGELVRLYNLGVGTSTLAKQFRTSPTTVSRRLQKAGVPIRPLGTNQFCTQSTSHPERNTNVA